MISSPSLTLSRHGGGQLHRAAGRNRFLDMGKGDSLWRFAHSARLAGVTPGQTPDPALVFIGLEDLPDPDSITRAIHGAAAPHRERS